MVETHTFTLIFNWISQFYFNLCLHILIDRDQSTTYQTKSHLTNNHSKFEKHFVARIKVLMNFAVDKYWKRLPVSEMFSQQIVLFVAALICAISSIAAAEYKVVETINGQVRGVLKTTLLKNRTFYSFKGIPYAEPPVGDLRFKVNTLLSFN